MPKFRVTRTEVVRVTRSVDAESTADAYAISVNGGGEIEDVDFISPFSDDAKIEDADSASPSSGDAKIEEIRTYMVNAAGVTRYSIYIDASSEVEAMLAAQASDEDEWEPDGLIVPLQIDPVMQIVVDDEEEDEDDEEDDEEQEDDDYAQQCVDAVGEISEILWPDGGSTNEWCSDTIMHIVETLRNYGFGPDE